MLGGRYWVYSIFNHLLVTYKNLKFMKTVNEAAKELEMVVNGKLSASFKRGVEFAQRFIPISEELPPHHVNILVIDSISKKESYGQFSQNMEWFHCHKSTNVFAKSDIVSWRPLYFL